LPTLSKQVAYAVYASGIIHTTYAVLTRNVISPPAGAEASQDRLVKFESRIRTSLPESWLMNVDTNVPANQQSAEMGATGAVAARSRLLSLRPRCARWL